MPNRIIKESICTSPNLDKLSSNAEVLFYRLIVNCDDFGRFEYNNKIIRSRCFPLRIDKVTDADINAWLTEIQNSQLVQLYAVDGRSFLQFTTWERHQQIRAKRSKYPSPDGNGFQMIANDSKCPRNPIQSESNPNPNTIYVCWNEQKIIIHKQLTDAISSAIYKSLNTYSEDEICSAIKTYAEILKDDKYYFKYSWTLKDFLNRGLEKFVNGEVARKNYLRDGGNGANRQSDSTNGQSTGDNPENEQSKYTTGKYGHMVRH